MGHHGGCRVMAPTMVGVFLLFSHVKNAQCSDSYMKKGGQIKMSILTFFPARSLLVVVCCVFCVDFVCVDCRVEYLKLGKVIPPQHLGVNDHSRMPSTCEYLPGLGEYSHVLGPGGGSN